MAKTREQKKDIINDLNEKMKLQKAIVLVDFSKIEAKKVFQLRNELKEAGCILKVVKKTLLEKALESLKQTKLLERIKNIKGQIALVFGFSDEVAPAKICYDFSKKEENLKILAGVFGEDWQDKEQVLALAILPSKPELLAKLVGVLSAPARNFVYVLNGNIKGLTTVLSRICETKQ